MGGSHRLAARRPNSRTSKLESPGWNERTRSGLEQLIERGSGQHLPVVLDFDNTIIRGDIGEATLAVLVRDGLLDPARLPPTLSPPFRLPDGRRITLDSGSDITAYYEAYLAPTVHGGRGYRHVQIARVCAIAGTGLHRSHARPDRISGAGFLS